MTMTMSVAICAWIGVAVLVGVMASMRGRVGYGWFLVALVISPLIVGPLVLALPRQYAQPRTTGRVGSVFKWIGITILFGCLVAAGAMFLALFLIIQHGGA
jgi:hypothetical protein